MFTGIVEAVGTLVRFDRKGDGAVIAVKTPESFSLTSRVVIGDSVANNGVCLTVTSLDGNVFTADVSAETVRNTAFASYTLGQMINLELACTPSTHLGGHIMQGHVDGVGEVVKLTPLSEAIDVRISCPHQLMRYMAKKGSVAVDGISLTINEVDEDQIRLTLIPHTQSGVNFASWRSGYRVNLEADVLSRYLERLLEAKAQDSAAKTELSLETLQQNGFI